MELSLEALHRKLGSLLVSQWALEEELERLKREAETKTTERD